MASTRVVRLSDIPTPALCVDLDVLRANIERMAAFFRDRPCALRPHVDPTVNLHDRLYAIRGEEVVEIWPVER